MYAKKYTDTFMTSSYDTGYMGHESILFYIKPFDEGWTSEEKYEFDFPMIKLDKFQNFYF